MIIDYSYDNQNFIKYLILKMCICEISRKRFLYIYVYTELYIIQNIPFYIEKLSCS